MSNTMKRIKRLSVEAQALIKELSQDEIKIIQKEHPFRRYREKLVRKLCERGVENKTLAEVSGLSDSTISRIRHDINDLRFRGNRKV